MNIILIIIYIGMQIVQYFIKGYNITLFIDNSIIL